MNMDFLNELSDEKLDEFYRPKKSNSRKSLAPLFIYLILENESSEKHPFTQTMLIKRLSAFPYEIDLGRQALGRTLHLLEDSGLGIVAAPGKGVWYDEDEIWEEDYAA